MPSIIVTGAGSGIGQATARTFLGAGWQVGLIGRRAEALEDTAGGNPAALVLPCDVTDPAAVEAAFGRAAKEWGRLDALFNNAGGSLPGRPIDEVSWGEWRGLMSLNVDGMFLCARAAFGQMRRQTPQGGRIINNGSISAHAPRPGSVGYTVSKHAVTGLTKTLALDGRPFDIACGQIDIGNAETQMTSRMSAGVAQADGSVKVEPRMDVEDVGRMVLHMASLPLSANIPFVTIMATKMPFIGRG